MNEPEIYQELTSIFREIFDDDGMELYPEMAARDVEEWDSFNHLNIIVASKLRFGVEFNTSEIGELECVGDLARLIQTKLGQGASV